MSRRSKYDEAFQLSAVGLVTSGRKAAEVARDLGLHVETRLSVRAEALQSQGAKQNTASSSPFEHYKEISYLSSGWHGISMPQ
jgi:transposase-like protein